MENYEQLLGLGAPLTSAFRSLSPSILGKRQVQTTPPRMPNQFDEMPGLGSLSELTRQLYGPNAQWEDDFSGIRSLLGGI